MCLPSALPLEQKDYGKAIAHSDAALHYELNTAWRARMLWHKGLYHYLAHDWQQAVSTWQALLQEFPASSSQAQWLFWLAKATDKLRAESAAEHSASLRQQATDYLARLADEHPLSYYHLVAARQETWYTQQRVAHLEDLLHTQSDLAVAEYRQHPVFGKTLQRAEILVNLQLLPLANFVLQTLEEQIAAPT